MAERIQWCVAHRASMIPELLLHCGFDPADPCNIKDAWVVMDDEVRWYGEDPAKTPVGLIRSNPRATHALFKMTDKSLEASDL